MANFWLRFRSLPVWAQIPIVVLTGLFAVGAVAAPFTEPEPDDRGVVASAATSTTSPAPLAQATTTTLSALPAGDDTAVVRVTDGDSLVVTDGTRIRLIGVDTPEVEGDDCFSAEATDHTRQLVGPGTQVRLVYDVGRLDRYDRTLAYVYRLPDGLFVNLALATDGFALQLTVPPNVRHAEEIGLAVADARNAKRGLWSACQTTTTATPAIRALAAPLVDDSVPEPEPDAGRTGAGRSPAGGRPGGRLSPVVCRCVCPDRVRRRLRGRTGERPRLRLRGEHPGHRPRRLRP